MTTETVDPRESPEEEILVVDYSCDMEENERLTTVVYSHDQVKDYLRKIGKRPLLEAQKEVELSKSIEAGLLAEKLLDLRAEEDPLERLEALESTAHGGELASDPESFASSLSVALGGIAIRMQGVKAEELEQIVRDGREATQVFNESNLRLVVSLAKRYTGRGLTFMEVIQEGNLGLMHAVEMFDFGKGYKFSTYATWWIRQSIHRAIANQSRTIRIPVHMAEHIAGYEKTKRKMEADLGRPPSIEEVAAELDVTREKVLEYIQYDRLTVSLDTPLGDGGGTGRGEKAATLQDMIEDGDRNTEEAATHSLWRAEIVRHLNVLPERKRGILMLRYGIGLDRPRTLEEVSEVYGVSKERIRQLEKEALNDLRKNEAVQSLKDIL